MAAVLIAASLRFGTDAVAVADLLRQAAVRAGCRETVVEMERRGPQAPLEIVVRCRETAPKERP